MADANVRKDLKLIDLRAIDLQHLWHPFTQAKLWQEQNDPLIIERAEGMELIDVDGRRYLDGVSSLWCNVHGHAVPELLSALHQQVDTLCHSTLLGLSHRPAIELTARLTKILPVGLTRIFYSDSGSTAVEAAVRMCLEWWQKKGTPAAKKKSRMLSLETGYHGDTLGAVGVGYLPAFHSALERNVVPALRVPPPHLYRFFENESEETAVKRSLEALSAMLSKRGPEIAGMIIEPLVQGAAGIWTYPEEFLRATAELCARHDVLLIVDEVATGFGKTGCMFACGKAEIAPDIMTIGKGLSGGYLPISAAAATEEIFAGFIGEPEELKTFYYGQTFAGNPLAACVSSANLDLFETSKLLEQLPTRIAFFAKQLEEKILPLPYVDEIRQCGMMVGVELTAEPGKRKAYPMQALAGAKIVEEARKRGVIIRPLGNVVVLLPPLAMREDDLARLVSITAESIRAALENLRV